MYCQAALLTDNSFERVINTNLVKEIREKIDAGSFDDAIALADELSASDPLKALFYRAEAAWYSGDLVLAVTHYASIIETPDAPADLKAKALVARGFFSWGDEEWQASLNDFEEALSIPEVTSESRTISLFALSVPMVALRSQQDVLAALTTAFEDGDRESQEFGGTPNDLLAMILKKGPSEWADYVAAITPLYVQHCVAEKLGQGITQSIQYLDEGGFSDSQRDTWNDAWQIAGKDCDDLQIPLECLDAAVDVMKSDPPTDRPLFRLPLEIRQLVRPLLNNTLGPAEDG